VRSLIFARDNQASMANIYGETLATGGTIEDIEAWPDRIKKVTTDDIKKVAARYLGSGSSVTGYLLPAEPIQN
jgi:zinc protease